MRILKLAICLLLLGGISVSCTKEDHSDCYNTYQLALKYMGDGTEDIFPVKINSVDMYVFDNMSKCVFHNRLSETDVKAQLTTLPPLDEGEYRIVCIGNGMNTQVQNKDAGDLSAITFAAKDYLNGAVVRGNDSLYWSAVNYAIQPYSEYKMAEVQTTYFASSHYDILVEILNAPASVGSNPKIELVGVSPLTDFNNVAEGEATTYIMDGEYDGDSKIVAKNNIMRHDNHEDVYLRVTGEDGALVAEVNFADYIAKNKGYINTQLNECLIPFSIEFGNNDLEISIKVPNWIVEYITPQL